MRFVHSGLATPAASLEDDLRVAARIGADGVEIAGAKLPAALERGGPAAVARLARGHGIAVTSIATLEDVTFRDLPALEALTAATHRWSEVARAVGARWLVAIPGERPDGADERDALREARESLRRLAAVTERYDVGLALSPVARPRASVRTLPAALAAIDAVGRRSLGLAPDTFELWAAGGAPDELKACPPRWLAQIRVADAPAGLDRADARAHHRRPPGLDAGVVPIHAWLDVARTLDAGVPVTCPVPPASAAGEEAEAWARRLRALTLEAAAAAPGRGRP